MKREAPGDGVGGQAQVMVDTTKPLLVWGLYLSSQASDLHINNMRGTLAVY